MIDEPRKSILGDVLFSPPRGSIRRPPARDAPAPPANRADPADSISSSQWELPAIPSASLDLGLNTDLSTSWSDAGASEHMGASSPPPSISPAKQARVSIQTASSDGRLTADELMAIWGRVGVQICEVATTLFEKSKKSLVGDGTYRGFVDAVLREVPNATVPDPPAYGHVIYTQVGTSVQRRVSDIMPGDVVELSDAKFKGHKGIQTYHQHVGEGEPLVGIVSEFEPKKSKIRVFQANQHVGQQVRNLSSYVS